jgi:hypothetical protein
MSEKDRQEMAACGLVQQNERGEWRCTEKGHAWGETLSLLATFEELLASGDIRCAEVDLEHHKIIRWVNE